MAEVNSSMSNRFLLLIALSGAVLLMIGALVLAAYLRHDASQGSGMHPRQDQPPALESGQGLVPPAITADPRAPRRLLPDEFSYLSSAERSASGEAPRLPKDVSGGESGRLPFPATRVRPLADAAGVMGWPGIEVGVSRTGPLPVELRPAVSRDGSVPKTDRLTSAAAAVTHPGVARHEAGKTKMRPLRKDGKIPAR